MIREQRKPLATQPQTQVTAASRVVAGLYVRRPEALVRPGYVTATVRGAQRTSLGTIARNRILDQI